MIHWREAETQVELTNFFLVWLQFLFLEMHIIQLGIELTLFCHDVPTILPIMSVKTSLNSTNKLKGLTKEGRKKGFLWLCSSQEKKAHKSQKMISYDSGS